ncbi:hypothetical protein [Alkanindiges illinoisensis]|uniref:Uncharacterized protein n=1 Tax=Alkanindiges illinoisensis TaxID=197183 RepID=A0A4Y7XDD8_9GAMM|nr:hypothetical protein [Alkanindiges illinoisensis]TEU29235.1 hypothetical protein E2B99_03985 [Alkanindiges illinoisensis]
MNSKQLFVLNYILEHVISENDEPIDEAYVNSQGLMVYDEAVKVFADYLKEYGNIEGIGQLKLMQAHLHRTFIFYGLEASKAKFETEQIDDLFSSGMITNKSRAVGQQKKDLEKLIKFVQEIQKLLHTTEACESILMQLTRERKRTIDHLDSLGIIESLALTKLQKIQPQGGRNKSRERQARLKMLSTLMYIAKNCNAPFKDANAGVFVDAIATIYEILKIEVNTFTRDFKEAKLNLKIAEE